MLGVLQHLSSAMHGGLPLCYESGVCTSCSADELGDRFCAVLKNRFSLALAP